jgi:hypothetical protein
VGDRRSNIKERLRALLSDTGSPPLHFSDHQIGRGQTFTTVPARSK